MNHMESEEEATKQFLSKYVDFDPASFPGAQGYKIQAITEELATKLADLTNGVNIDMDKPLDPSDD